MSGVFISYAREDRATAERLARELEASGWQVWWDVQLVPGKSFRAEIRQRLDRADCVVVLWSRHSVVSDFVLDEADVGLHRRILVPAMIETDVDLPLGFRGVHAADLAGWRGGRKHPGVADLVEAVSTHLRGAPPARRRGQGPRPTLQPRSRPRGSGAAPPAKTRGRGPGLTRDQRRRPGDRAGPATGAAAQPATGARVVLANRYELGPLLGQGELSEVFKGRDPLLERTVAIRMPPAYQHVSDDRVRARLLIEARAAAGINHPNVVAIYDAGVDTGRFFVVIEYVAGSSLRALLHQEGKLATARAVSVAADACSGLAAAHRIGIAHGDLRPGSIMVTRDLAKVGNFGVRAPAGDALPAAVTATARYLAPEQVQGAVVDARSDLYALGCCLYEMLTGEPPFDGSSPVEIAYRHVREEPQPPSRKRRGLPAALDAVTLRALAKDPGDRFPSAVDMRAALGQAAQV